MKALIAKELRENLKWLLVGLVIMSLLTWAAVPNRIEHSYNSLTPYLGFASALFAFGLGLLQSVWDLSDGQKGFLFHRAASKNQILASKLIAGAIIYSLALGLPLLLTAIYFTVMGPQYLPVRPMQVVAPLLMVTLCFAIHPATMLMIARPAKWFGTKVLPLVLPATVCVLFYGTCDNSWYCWVFFGLDVVMLSLLTTGLFSASFERASLALNSPIATIGLVFLFIIAPVIYFGSQTVGMNHTWNEYGVDDNGNMWRYKYSRYQVVLNQEYATNYVSGSQLISGQPADFEGKLPPHFHANFAGAGISLEESTRNGTIRMVSSMGSKSIFWDTRGYFLVYNLRNDRGLAGVITRDGLNKGPLTQSNKFDSVLVPGYSSANYLPEFYEPPQGRMRNWVLVPDRKGLYMLDQATGSLEIVVDEPISKIYPVRAGINLTHSFIVETDQHLDHYRIDATDLSPQASNSSPIRPGLVHVASYPKLPEVDVSKWSLALAPNGTLTAFGWESGYRGKLAKIEAGPNAVWQLSDVADRKTSSFPIGGRIVQGSLPLVLQIVATGYLVIGLLVQGKLVSSWYDSSVELGSGLGLVGITSIAIILLSALWVYYLLRVRSADRRTTMLWLLLTIPLGIATPLALIAIVPKPSFERCSKCDCRRRVDRNKCEHCGNGWEPLPSQGIEILESQRFESMSITS